MGFAALYPSYACKFGRNIGIVGWVRRSETHEPLAWPDTAC
jgi:hypothetical protein